LSAWGVVSLVRTPLDAIPDLSDVQVTIRTTFPGQAPQIVENQVTYPLATTMLSVPGAKAVRGYSMFGDSFVYVLFDDGTDLYWARSRVLEYLNQAQSRLPAQAKASIGPDAETTELPANDGQPRRRTSELGEDRQQKQQSGHGQHEARHRPDDHAVQAQQGRRDEPSVQIALAVAAVKDSEGIDTSLARWRARPSGTSRRHASGRCRRGCRKRAAGW